MNVVCLLAGESALDCLAISCLGLVGTAVDRLLALDVEATLNVVELRQVRSMY